MRLVVASMVVIWLTLAAAVCVEAGYPDHPTRLSHVWERHAGYRLRVYYGDYYRWPYDYRTQFDLPWHAGPSRAHWPIPAPSPTFCDPGPTIIATPYQ